MTDLYQLRPLEWRTEKCTIVRDRYHHILGRHRITELVYNDSSQNEYWHKRVVYQTLEEAKEAIERELGDLLNEIIIPASPASIVARYEELKSQGLIVTGQGSATVNIEGRQE